MIPHAHNWRWRGRRLVCIGCGATHGTTARRSAAWAAIVALLAFALFGCSGSQHRSWDADAHIGINSAAHALVLEDGVLSAAAQYDTATGTTDAQLVARYQAAATQEQVTLASLVLLDHGVSLAIATGAASDRCRLVYLATHANQSIVDLRGVLTPLGQSVPADVSSAVPLLAAIATAAAPSCASSGSPQP